MKPIERVYAALNHRRPDKIPKGEIVISPRFVEKLTGCSNGYGFDETRKVLNILRADLVAINADPTFPPYLSLERSFSQVKRWTEETNYFVFALVGGAFSITATRLGFKEYCCLAVVNPSEVAKITQRIVCKNIQIARHCIELGAHGVIIADDIAYNERTFFSPKMLRDLIFPALKEEVEAIKKMNIPVLFHSDGNLNAVVDDLVEIGFDGLHGLQSSAGMDIIDMKKKHGHLVTLMGNFEVDSLFSVNKGLHAQESIKNTIQICGINGGYILSSCGGAHDQTPPENVLRLYEFAENFGVGVNGQKAV